MSNDDILEKMARKDIAWRGYIWNIWGIKWGSRVSKLRTHRVDWR